jgi:LCP family protein required for cell wall assembly
MPVRCYDGVPVMQFHRVPPRPLIGRLLAIGLGLTVAIGCGSAVSPSPTAPSASVEAPATAGPGPSSSAHPSIAPASSPTAPGPAGSPALGGERLTVLLIGLDHTSERDFSELSDTLIVASLDPVAGTVSLLGLPRDLTDFPLPSGAIYRQKLNSLYTEIQANPARFGGGAGDDPFTVLAGVIGNLVDVPIDHWAAIDMDGFAGMIDELGGVDAYVADPICDPGYHQLGLRGFEAPAGWWHLTGPQALGLARVRHDAGGSDFQRLRRQLNLLTQIREAIVAAGASEDPLGWLAKVPSIRTDLSPETILAAAGVAAAVSPGRIHSRLVQPFGSGGTELYDNRGYVLSANIDEIREISSLLFTETGTRPTTGKPDAPPDKPATVKDLPRFNGC